MSLVLGSIRQPRLATSTQAMHRSISNRVLMSLLLAGDFRGELDWTVWEDATITRAHQRATNCHGPNCDRGGSRRGILVQNCQAMFFDIRRCH